MCRDPDWHDFIAPAALSVQQSAPVGDAVDAGDAGRAQAHQALAWTGIALTERIGLIRAHVAGTGEGGHAPQLARRLR